MEKGKEANSNPNPEILSVEEYSRTQNSADKGKGINPNPNLASSQKKADEGLKDGEILPQIPTQEDLGHPRGNSTHPRPARPWAGDHQGEGGPAGPPKGGSAGCGSGGRAASPAQEKPVGLKGGGPTDLGETYGPLGPIRRVFDGGGLLGGSWRGKHGEQPMPRVEQGQEWIGQHRLAMGGPAAREQNLRDKGKDPIPNPNSAITHDEKEELMMGGAVHPPIFTGKAPGQPPTYEGGSRAGQGGGPEG